MKTRKILAVLLVVAVLAISMTVMASAADYSVYSNPTKSTYTDNECFDPTGLVVSDGYTNVDYATEYQYFTFSVELDEKLDIYTTEIEVFYKGQTCGTVSINVGHAGGEITQINNHHHGQICEGCGGVCKNEEHNVTFWVPNGDAGLVTSETETGTCTVCGDTVSRYIEGTATFTTIFADIEILQTILGLVMTIVQAFALI